MLPYWYYETLALHSILSTMTFCSNDYSPALVYLSGRVWSWFQSYLDNRSQSISVNGATSKQFDLQHGVPQGSCLIGPLLFVMYASKLFSALEDHLPDVHAYADDTQLYVSFKPNGDADQSAAVTVMQNCMH